MKKFGIGLIGLVTVGLFSACGDSGQKTQAEEDKKLSVVTTFYPMYEFTKNIVGEEGQVDLLIPAGTEAHDYEPSAKKIAQISEADVFVYHNENMEGWVPKTVKSWGENKPQVVKGTKDMLLLPGGDDHGHDHGEGEEGHHHELDPHTWVAPSMAIKEVESIKKQLVDLYPERKKAFETNAEKFLKQLTELDDAYQNSLTGAKQKSFVTQHAAFGYLANQYGLTQVPIAGLSTSKEPSPSRVAELKHYVQDNGIKYIYFEENASDKIARTLAKEADVQLAVLNPLESLTQKQIDQGETYISVMKENLAALEKTTKVAGKEIQPEEKTEEKTVAAGYFKDDQVKDRSLSDYVGEWQSVYPLLQDGTLDQVFDYKAKAGKDKTTEEYKAYYEKGYRTPIEKVSIKGNTMDFLAEGVSHSYTYTYKGYKILDYEKGNRGVRYLFETTDPDAGSYRFVQFSDHGITPSKAVHFHLFHGGESQEALYKEMDNWPTYYPETSTKQEIAQEMLVH